MHSVKLTSAVDVLRHSLIFSKQVLPPPLEVPNRKKSQTQGVWRMTTASAIVYKIALNTMLLQPIKVLKAYALRTTSATAVGNAQLKSSRVTVPPVG